MEGRPARIEPVFISQTDPTWFNPSAQHERITVISSTCGPMFEYQSETHMPLSPYCFHVRFEGIKVLSAVPHEVCLGLPIESGMGLPASLASRGLGSNRSTWLGPPSMKHQITDFAIGA